MAFRFFGRHIEPSCSYCIHGETSFDRSVIFCRLKGAIEPGSSCRRFDYAPFKRIPKGEPTLPMFRPEDFSL